jgi:uncharacterized protein
MPASAKTRRIASLDVLRGLAVLAILLVNAAYFAYPWQSGPNPLLEPGAPGTLADWVVFNVVKVVFEAKFVSLFSMLFGVSVYLIGKERGAPEGRILRSRLFWLFLIGLIHGALIWYGDILLSYAIAGLLVMLARSWRVGALLAGAAVLYGLALLVIVGGGLAMTFIPPDQLPGVEAEVWAPGAQEMDRAVAALGGTLASAGAENLRVWVDTGLNSLPAYLLMASGLMMLGLALYKTGFFDGNWQPARYLGLVIAAMLALSALAWNAWQNHALGYPFLHMMGLGGGLNLVLAPVVTLGYASAIILALRAGSARWLTQALAPVGRMAFTNYLTQSVIMTSIFYGGRGLGLFGEVGRTELFLICLAIWAVQIAWSHWWLQRYAYGPLEWIWRSLTLGRLVPIRLAQPG